jgi:hypothetical protein
MQQKRGALFGRQALEQDEEGDRQRVRHLRLARGIVIGAGHDRLWQPFAHVGPAGIAPSGDCRSRAVPQLSTGTRAATRFARRSRELGEGGGTLPALVLRLTHAAEHPVGDGKRRRAKLYKTRWKHLL